MAAQKYYANIELNQNQIKNIVVETTTPATVGSTISGRVIFDTGNSILKYYDGTNWQSVETRFDGQILYKGNIAHDADSASSPVQGDLYVFSSAGTATNYGNVVVEVGDYVIYDGTNWKVIQGNVILASETNSGLVRLADEVGYSEVTLETDDVVMTPADAYIWADQTNKTVVRKRVYTGETINSSGSIYTHGIGKDDVRVTVYDSNSNIINLQVVKGSGTVTVTSNSEESGLTVVISA
jgi:hypothetical protein